MGRAGAGGGSRSSGGHRIGGSSGSRAGAGTSRGGMHGGSGSGGSRGSMHGGPRGGFNGGHGGPRGGMMPGRGIHRGPGMMHRGGMHGGPGMPPPRHRHIHRRGGHSLLTGLLTCVIVIVILFVAIKDRSTVRYNKTSDRDVQAVNSKTETVERKKLNTNNEYINDCIKDELGWFENVSNTETKLKEFWEETGVQPYIILKSYDSSLKTDNEKEEWTANYYDKNFDAENIFLYVYFAEEDTDNDVGYMCYTCGTQTSSVMDSEAIEIFWDNIEEYWVTDLSTDEVFINTFSDTAETIMSTSAN